MGGGKGEKITYDTPVSHLQFYLRLFIKVVKTSSSQYLQRKRSDTCWLLICIPVWELWEKKHTSHLTRLHIYSSFTDMLCSIWRQGA